MTEHFNRLTPDAAESLALIAEEAGEIVQAVCKSLRHGLWSTNPDIAGDVTNCERIHHEIGDLLAAVDIALGLGLLDRVTLDLYRKDKLSRVARYLHHAKVPGGAINIETGWFKP